MYRDDAADIPIDLIIAHDDRDGDVSPFGILQRKTGHIIFFDRKIHYIFIEV